MLTPTIGNVLPANVLWAADTGCFRNPETFSFVRYLRWLNDHAAEGDAERCLFATAPDVFGDARRTLERSIPTLPLIRDIGYPAAFIAQDGAEELPIPWDDLDALFVGGTDRYKSSEAMFELAREAKRRGKWIHQGRVNTRRRFRIMEAAGFDSADGTFLRYGPDTLRPRLERWPAASDGLGL